jgi:hypothetical protein
MLGFAWLTLRQAQEALKSGRLEDAQRLLVQPAACGHKRSFELLAQLARGFVERGGRHLQQDNTEGAWNDLVAAEHVGGVDEEADRLRQALTRLGVAEVRDLLVAGDPARAAELASQFRRRSVSQPELQLLEEIARAWGMAREQASRGEFAQALATIERVRRLHKERIEALEQFVRTLEQRHQTFSALLVQLHEAAEQRDWREVVRLAEQVLALAPQHAEARKARARAWRTVEPETRSHTPQREVGARAGEPPAPGERFLLWIDGVGGYLVCLGNRVTVGQAIPEAPVDVPLFADVSRLHAALVRDTEGYLLEASRSLSVNGKPAEKVLLQDGDRVTLGNSCQIQFRQPVPVSASARLDLVSRHRLPLSVEGVILMADTLVLGPGKHVHVEVPDLKQPVVLYRLQDGLGVRYDGDLTVDGQVCKERGLLRPHSTVTGEDFAFAIEPVGTTLGRM